MLTPQRVILQIMDMLVEQTHDVRHQWRNNERGMRFTDTRLDEQQRGVSLKMVPMTLVMEGSSGKSHAMNLVDTPGACPWRVCLSRPLSL
jgi:116 kDa U5 small nuclear ribonucleoprotein component